MNYSAAGARCLVVSGHVEDADRRSSYENCLSGCEVQMVRLVAPIEILHERIRARGRVLWADLDVQARLSAKVHDQLAHAQIEDFVVTNDRPLAVVAEEILERSGWPH